MQCIDIRQFGKLESELVSELDTAAGGDATNCSVRYQRSRKPPGSVCHLLVAEKCYPGVEANPLEQVCSTLQKGGEHIDVKDHLRLDVLGAREDLPLK